MSDKLLSIREAARLLGLGYHGGREAILRAGVKVHVFGPRNQLVDRGELDALIRWRGMSAAERFALMARGERLLNAA